MTLRIAALLLASLGLPACRDTQPFVIERPDWPDSAPVRLTFNPGDDRAPVWNAAGDSIFFVADGYRPFSVRPGIVLALPRAGGDASAVMGTIQFGSTREPVLGAVATSANRVAFLEITEFEQYECEPLSCPGVNPEVLAGAHLQLRRGVIRVRQADAGTGVDESSLQFEFEGAVADSTRQPFNVQFVHVHTTHPYHRLYNAYEDAFFRPSWSPDGQSVVFSDGLDLYRWTVGAAAATLIPNTTDAVWPAWSPDGQSIAFTRLNRIAAGRIDCFCVSAKGAIGAVYETTLFQNPGRIGRLTLINADGSNVRDLGDGTAPAWLPSGGQIIAARTTGLFLIDVANGAATLIPNTAGGTEPAVSPDGRTLAFARSIIGATHDLYTIELP